MELVSCVVAHGEEFCLVSEDRLLPISAAAEMLGVGISTLRQWDADGTLEPIRTPGGHRRYLLSDVLEMQGREQTERPDEVAVYCRVSSQDQKKGGDLERQEGRVLKHCSKNGYKVGYALSDVGSGMSVNRPRLRRLFKLVMARQINRVIVEHRDRLTRFCFGVYEAFFNSYGVEIECCKNTLPKTFEAELVEDMLSLMSSFSARIYGKRSAERRRKKKSDATRP